MTQYQLPQLDLLQSPDPATAPRKPGKDLLAKAQLIRYTLKTSAVKVTLGNIVRGPTITRYELQLAPGAKLERLISLSDQLAVMLNVERLDVVAPIPGAGSFSVGIEVPNALRTTVVLRDLLESEAWRDTPARLPIALGKDMQHQPVIADLAALPHLMIAGCQGSGKSVLINSLIASLLYRFSPAQLRFLMIDPMLVDLQRLEALPHLVAPVLEDPAKAMRALRWVIAEMEKRFEAFARAGVCDIETFNERSKDKPARQPGLGLSAAAGFAARKRGGDGLALAVDKAILTARRRGGPVPQRLARLVVVITEWSALTVFGQAEAEMLLSRITQTASAAGIHCIVATRRADHTVLTGVMKAGIPARIALQLPMRVDSRTILDAMGADKLLGKGDMFYLAPGAAKLSRLQAPLVTDLEMQRIVDSIAK